MSLVALPIALRGWSTGAVEANMPSTERGASDGAGTAAIVWHAGLTPDEKVLGGHAALAPALLGEALLFLFCAGRSRATALAACARWMLLDRHVDRVRRGAQDGSCCCECWWHGRKEEGLTTFRLYASSRRAGLADGTHSR